jgi:hypothetical protein
VKSAWLHFRVEGKNDEGRRGFILKFMKNVRIENFIHFKHNERRTLENCWSLVNAHQFSYQYVKIHHIKTNYLRRLQILKLEVDIRPWQAVAALVREKKATETKHGAFH